MTNSDKSRREIGPARRIRIGIDVGGTFTDACLFEEETGEIRVAKVPSTPNDPSVGILDSLSLILSEAGATSEQVTYLAHGTTVATNTLLEHSGAKVGLITTRGFRDLLELARQVRPDLYDLQVDKPEPLIRRDLRMEVDERVYADGHIERVLRRDDIRRVVRLLRDRGVEAIAVCLLYSYLLPEHEDMVKEVIRQEFPEAYVSLSHEVLPEFREYERLSTTVVNAYLTPVVSKYVANLRDKVREAGVRVNPYITQSNGGVISLDVAQRNTIRTVLSGPSTGATGGAYVARLAGFLDVITFDMGGTSTDVCLVEHGTPKVATQREIEGYPIKTPMIDIHTVGAGGGSIAWIDPGGLLKVGPRSAGARPGPACYGHGGQEATVTDAHVLLGTLNPDYLLGGRMKIDAGKARAAIGKLAVRLGMEEIEVAHGIIRVVVSNMVRAVRFISIQRGYDVRDFTLVAFGGAGPLHACWLARELGIPRVLVPESPGILCAFGLLATDVKSDYTKTEIVAADGADVNKVNRIFQELESRGAEWLAKEGITESNRLLRRSVDMRYVGQNYELTVPVREGDLQSEGFQDLVRYFYSRHEQEYGYHSETESTQLVTFRVEAVGVVPKAELRSSPMKVDDPSVAERGTRRVCLGDVGKRYVECPIYDRSRLVPGNRLQGPAIVEQLDSTVVILSGQTATMDQYRNIVIGVFGEENSGNGDS
ncbi:MAG: hydantoinase/oxoprolinase family protein [Phycisphaerae bacterium]|nr:hydantoinase/oxoprolinase family protein [Phycisphaerae bacterium]